MEAFKIGGCSRHYHGAMIGCLTRSVLGFDHFSIDNDISELIYLQFLKQVKIKNISNTFH